MEQFERQVINKIFNNDEYVKFNTYIKTIHSDEITNLNTIINHITRSPKVSWYDNEYKLKLDKIFVFVKDLFEKEISESIDMVYQTSLKLWKESTIHNHQVIATGADHILYKIKSLLKNNNLITSFKAVERYVYFYFHFYDWEDKTNYYLFKLYNCLVRYVPYFVVSSMFPEKKYFDLTLKSYNHFSELQKKEMTALFVNYKIKYQVLKEGIYKYYEYKVYNSSFIEQDNFCSIAENILLKGTSDKINNEIITNKLNSRNIEIREDCVITFNEIKNKFQYLRIKIKDYYKVSNMENNEVLVNEKFESLPLIFEKIEKEKKNHGNVKKNYVVYIEYE